ncbi:MAG: hypothetical protein WAW42_18480 [Candidatus Competibacteraceae bacterium]
MIITSLWNRGNVTASGSNSPVDVLKKAMQLINHFLFLEKNPGWFSQQALKCSGDGYFFD